MKNWQNTGAVMVITGSASFNRYTVCYKATSACRGEFSYMCKDETITEIFYLDASENGTFSSFTDGYLDGIYADKVLNVTAEPLENGGMCEISAVETERCESILPDTCFFENEYLRVGAELAWGGGLSYIADKHCKVKDLENLLNHFDTGRLVQQSYYGTHDKPYECGEFMGKVWCYNPVQGGDRAKYKSKLIDVKIANGSAWVKCCPRDWGHAGSYTKSYMENTYTLDGEVLKVDNRFTDYSGWKHPKKTQELPAFYTVSYLSDFYFYDGDNPWQNDELQVRQDLYFWPENWPKHTFNLKKDNTETWCAWVDGGKYGIGLYVPGVEGMIGGRFSFNASRDPADIATNYVAPQRRIQLKAFVPLTYSYLICTGELDKIRETFAKRRDFTDNASLAEY